MSDGITCTEPASCFPFHSIHFPFHSLHPFQTSSLPTHSTLRVLASVPFLELNMLTCTSGPLSLPILFPLACSTFSAYPSHLIRSHFLREATLAQPISNYNYPNSPTLLILLPDLFFLYSTSHHLTS